MNLLDLTLKELVKHQKKQIKLAGNFMGINRADELLNGNVILNPKHVESLAEYLGCSKIQVRHSANISKFRKTLRDAARFKEWNQTKN